MRHTVGLDKHFAVFGEAFFLPLGGEEEERVLVSLSG